MKIIFFFFSCFLWIGCHRNTETLTEDTYEWDKFYQQVPDNKTELAFALEPEQILEIYWQNLETGGESILISLTETHKAQIEWTTDGKTTNSEEKLQNEQYQQILQKLQNPQWLELQTEYTRESTGGFNLVLTFWKDISRRQETKSVCFRTYFHPELFRLLEELSPLFRDKLPLYQGMLALVQAQKE
ncbi:MAG: hypothetical protein AABZ60_02080 [Planctomycetota bacterium]